MGNTGFDVCTEDWGASTAKERQAQIDNVRAFQQGRNALAPARETSSEHRTGDEGDADIVYDGRGLRYLQDTAHERRNVFEALMEAVKTHSLGQIRHAPYDVGGEYRRNM